MKVISDINEQRSSKTTIKDTASEIKTDDTQESRRRTKISIMCLHCGKSVEQTPSSVIIVVLV